MPVEVRELIIRATIKDNNQPTNQKDGQETQNAMTENQEAIVASCVKQVLRILEKNKER